MAILYTQAFDIISGQEAAYENFIADYIPRSNKLGLQSVGGFYVVCGFGPRIIHICRAESIDDLCRILSTKEFRDLLLDIKRYVVNFRSKILEPTGRVKHQEYELRKGIWKFNQYYDLIPGKKKDYADFIINEYLPVIEKIDYVEVTGGWNVLIGGVSEIIGEFTFKSPVDIARILENPDFQRITDVLRTYVVNYVSRIMRVTERFEESRWYRL
ncbi:MAG: hypothetical protein V2B19_13815 [Pseudomonadota bacterium]